MEKKCLKGGGTGIAGKKEKKGFFGASGGLHQRCKSKKEGSPGSKRGKGEAYLLFTLEGAMGTVEVG